MAKKLARNQQGVGIIEVLVALVIASIGLLGIVAIQTNRVKMAQQEVQMSVSTILATEMAERMRANIAGVGTGGYDDVDTSANDTPNNPNCTSCTPSQIADRDIFEWKEKVNRNLIDGKGTIEKLVAYDGAALPSDSGHYKITLSWKDKVRQDEDGNAYVDPSHSINVVIKDFTSEIASE